MSGTKRIDALLSGQEIDVEEPKKFGFFVNRVLVSILQALLRAVNRQAGDAITVAANTTLDGSEGWVGVNAAAGPITITLSAPTALFHPLTVQKVDASANAVTVAAPAGTTVNGVASLNLAAQWDKKMLLADDTAYYA